MRPPLSRRRVAELIRLRKSLYGHVIETSGYAGRWAYEVFTRRAATWDMHDLRARAYRAPQHFPVQALSLSEWAKIKHWQQTTENT